jgi:hypothetical protein
VAAAAKTSATVCGKKQVCRCHGCRRLCMNQTLA